MMRSLETKLAALPDETTVHPGHGPQTTIGRKKINPYLSRFTDGQNEETNRSFLTRPITGCSMTYSGSISQAVLFERGKGAVYC